MDLFCEASFLEFLFERAYKKYTVVSMPNIQKFKTIGRINAIIHYVIFPITYYIYIYFFQVEYNIHFEKLTMCHHFFIAPCQNKYRGKDFSMRKLL